MTDIFQTVASAVAADTSSWYQLQDLSINDCIRFPQFIDDTTDKFRGSSDTQIDVFVHLAWPKQVSAAPDGAAVTDAAVDISQESTSQEDDGIERVVAKIQCFPVSTVSGVLNEASDLILRAHPELLLSMQTVNWIFKVTGFEDYALFPDLLIGQMHHVQESLSCKEEIHFSMMPYVTVDRSSDSKRTQNDAELTPEQLASAFGLKFSTFKVAPAQSQSLLRLGPARFGARPVGMTAQLNPEVEAHIRASNETARGGADENLQAKSTVSSNDHHADTTTIATATAANSTAVANSAPDTTSSSPSEPIPDLDTSVPDADVATAITTTNSTSATISTAINSGTTTGGAGSIPASPTTVSTAATTATATPPAKSTASLVSQPTATTSCRTPRTSKLSLPKATPAAPIHPSRLGHGVAGGAVVPAAAVSWPLRIRIQGLHCLKGYTQRVEIMKGYATRVVVEPAEAQTVFVRVRMCTATDQGIA